MIHWEKYQNLLSGSVTPIESYCADINGSRVCIKNTSYDLSSNETWVMSYEDGKECPLLGKSLEIAKKEAEGAIRGISMKESYTSYQSRQNKARYYSSLSNTPIGAALESLSLEGTKIVPNNEKIISMVNFNDNVVVATESNVYVMNADFVLRKVPFESIS